jgi:hypothetical protein
LKSICNKQFSLAAWERIKNDPSTAPALAVLLPPHANGTHSKCDRLLRCLQLLKSPPLAFTPIPFNFIGVEMVGWEMTGSAQDSVNLGS